MRHLPNEIAKTKRSPNKGSYLCVYSLIDRVLKCIEHCATAKAYGKFREAGIMTKMEAVEENIIKSTKEKDNVEKGVN